MTMQDQAIAIWKAGVAAVDGYGAVKAALPNVPRPDLILAVGKAAAAMMNAAQDHSGKTKWHRLQFRRPLAPIHWHR